MAYYDDIAKRWHEATGYKGGAFKELVLNDLLLAKIPPIDNLFILELGAGNGYFLPMVIRRFSGQLPSGITVTDKSEKLLEICRRHFRVPGAEYQCLDVCKPFPLENNHFDLIITSMVFNEVPANCFKTAVKECYRVLNAEGVLLISVIHPDFVSSLQKRALLKPDKKGVLTMPGSGSLRLPVVIRPRDIYRNCLQEAGFQYEETEASPSQKVLNLKAGLRNASKIPIVLIYRCTKL